MDHFFVDGNMPQNTFTHVTVPGVILICVVLLVLFYYLVCQKKFAPAPAAAGLQTSSHLLRLAEQDQWAVGKGAGFQGGPEPPVFWGESGSDELYRDQRMNIGAEGADMNADSSKASFHSGGKSRYTDEYLLSGPGKGR